MPKLWLCVERPCSVNPVVSLAQQRLSYVVFFCQALHTVPGTQKAHGSFSFVNQRRFISRLVSIHCSCHDGEHKSLANIAIFSKGANMFDASKSCRCVRHNLWVSITHARFKMTVAWWLPSLAVIQQAGAMQCSSSPINNSSPNLC